MKIILMLNYARSGGTLLNKCLASLPNVIMLSEVNPLGGGWGELQEKSFTTVHAQALHWYNINLKVSSFKENIQELEHYCKKHKKQLILRDWSFINFSKHQYNNNSPPNKFLTIEVLKGLNIKPFAFIRDSIDVWISRGMPNIDKFYSEYLNYILELKRLNVKIFKYEDFVMNPKRELKRICEYVGIEYIDVIQDCLNYSKVNGDTQVQGGSRGSTQSFIRPIPRKKISIENIYKINSSKKVKIANNIIGYPTGYYKNFIKDNIVVNSKYLLKKILKIAMIKKIQHKLKNLFLKPKPKFGLNNEANRKKWIKKTLKSIPEGYRILDAGAGELKYKEYCSHLQYVSQDFGQYDGQGDDTGLQTKDWDNSKLDIVSDITKIPESAASFDAIMCIEVFEHLPNPVLAIKEFSRLLKKDGALIITAPFASLTHFAPYHYYSGFNKYFYVKHLEDYGFEIKEIQRNGSFFEYLAQEIQLRIPNKYTSYIPSLKEKKAINTLLSMLEKMNKSDKKSNELLTFGYHIKAIKK